MDVCSGRWKRFTHARSRSLLNRKTHHQPAAAAASLLVVLIISYTEREQKSSRSRNSSFANLLFAGGSLMKQQPGTKRKKTKKNNKQKEIEIASSGLAGWLVEVQDEISERASLMLDGVCDGADWCETIVSQHVE